ncbi:hypothetical protein [Actinomadura sp. NBRC 104412]|nr:hypothetical protein [Actinomadura sp. NBRC 104412]
MPPPSRLLPGTGGVLFTRERASGRADRAMARMNVPENDRRP